jgi:DNA-binding Lrp family transcriptional regulator
LAHEHRNNTIDELDLRILAELSKDARQSSRVIAELIGVSTGTVYNRIRKMTERQVIQGYIPLLDHVKVGYVFTVLILIQVEGEHIVNVEENLASIKEVVAVYDITGEFDVAVLAKFKSQPSLNNFIKTMLKMPHVQRTVTNMVLNTVKEDHRLRFE